MNDWKQQQIKQILEYFGIKKEEKFYDISCNTDRHTLQAISPIPSAISVAIRKTSKRPVRAQWASANPPL
jgi:hypothetical protein